MILEALDERFGIIPTEIIEQIRNISKREWLKSLHRQAIRCSDIEKFKEMLSKAMPSPKSQNEDK